MNDIRRRYPALVQSMGRTLVADLGKIKRYIPAPRRRLITPQEIDDLRAEVRALRRRADVETKERVVLQQRIARLEKGCGSVHPRAITR